MKVELHCHSNCSDGSATVEEILKYAEKTGLGAVAITDHNNMNSIKRAKKYRGDILFIPGIEVSSDKGHILVLGSEEMPPKTLEGIADFAKSRDAVTIAAHPFGGVLRPGAAKYLGMVHAVEVLNGKTFSWHNKKAMEAAKHFSKVSGSDAHLLEEVGLFACSVGADSVDGILREIRKGHAMLPEKSRSALSIIWSAWKIKVHCII